MPEAHDHNRGRQSIGQGAIIGNDRNTHDPVGNRISGAGIDNVGVADSVDFKKVAIITAGGKPLIVQIDNLIHIVKRSIFARAINPDAPKVTVRAFAGCEYFTPDFYQIVVKSEFVDDLRNLIDPISFGNR